MPDRLRSILEACSILAGQTKVPPSSSPSNDHDPAISSSPLCQLLNQRIDGFWTIGGRDGWSSSLHLHQQSSASPTNERQSKLASARLALAALGLLSDLEASSSVAKQGQDQGPPPLYGLKDNKTISILCGLIARWGIGQVLPRGILPSDMQDQKKEVEKISEIISNSDSDNDEEDESEEEMLQEMVGDIVRILLPPTSQQADGGRTAKQLQALVLPGLMLHTLAALLYLSHTSSSDKTSYPKPNEALEDLLNLYADYPDSIHIYR